MRKRLFEIVEKANENDRISAAYDIAMIMLIVLSLVPLAFKETNVVFRVIDRTCATVFIIDYLLRWATADYRAGKKGALAFLLYPFTVTAMVDLLSILPSLTVLNSGFKVLRVLRLVRTLRVFRVIKAMRYSRSFEIMTNVFRRSKHSLIAVTSLAVAYVLASALIIFNVEPETFDTFFDAVYWATVSLTTVGYGDIYPVSTFGRIITMLSSVLGIAIVALPAGIITAGYMSELRRDEQNGGQ